MGKRKRTFPPKKGKGNSQAQKGNKASHSRNSRDKRDAPPTKDPLDIDENCVDYKSGSDVGSAEPKTFAPMECDESIAKDPDDSSADDDDDDDDDDSAADIELGPAGDGESDVEVGIEFFDPCEPDITPVAVFLEKFAHESVGVTKGSVREGDDILSARGLSEAVCAQTRVGTTVRVTDESAPVGFISCLNVHEHRELLDPLKKHLVGVCGGADEEHARFARLVKKTFEVGAKFENHRMGLILCERVVNLPPQVVPKMLEALFCEIEWAVEDEPTEALRESFRFGWFMYVTEVYVGPGGGKVGASSEGRDGEGSKSRDARKQQMKKRKRGATAAESTTIDLAFTRIEDEVWHEHSLCTVMWDIAGAEVEKGGFRRRRMAMIIGSGKIARVRPDVEHLVGLAAGTRVDEGEEEEKEEEAKAAAGGNRV